MNISKLVALFVVFGGLLLGGYACGQEKKTDAAADAEAEALKSGLETLIQYKAGGLPVSDEGFVNGFTKLLELGEKGSLRAPEIVVEIAKQEKTTSVRVLKALRKDAEAEQQKSIDKLLAKIEPKKRAAPTQEQIKAADAAVDNLKVAIDSLIEYRAGGLPVGDEGFIKGIDGLLKAHEDGSTKAAPYVVEIAGKEKATVLKVLKAARKGADDDRVAVIDSLLEKIDPKKKKEEKK